MHRQKPVTTNIFPPEHLSSCNYCGGNKEIICMQTVYMNDYEYNYMCMRNKSYVRLHVTLYTILILYYTTKKGIAKSVLMVYSSCTRLLMVSKLHASSV